MSFLKQPYKIDSIIISILQMKKQVCKVQSAKTTHLENRETETQSVSLLTPGPWSRRHQPELMLPMGLFHVLL